MVENRNELNVEVASKDGEVRHTWSRPVFRTLNAQEAESGSNSGSDLTYS